MGGEIILKIFIKVMEAGIAFSFMIAIILSYYRIENLKKKRIVIIISFVLGLIAAIISTVIRNIPHFINRTELNFWSMVPIVISLFLILIFIIFKDRLSKKLSENIMSLAITVYTVGLCFYYLPAVFNQANKFVYYGESAVSTMVLFRILGFVFGVIMMILTGLEIYKCASKLDEKNLKSIVILSLIASSITQINLIVQRFYSKGIIPRNVNFFKIIAAIANHENLFLFLNMLIIAFVPIILYRENVKITEPYKNSAQLRKIKYRMRNKRRWAIFCLIVLVINTLSLTAGKAFANREEALSPPEDYETVDGMIEIPLSSLEDMHLHRYLYKAKDGVEMRFFAIKKSEGSYGVVLDACEICGPSGYFERGDDVVCKLCDVVMNRGTIGFAGGCNPIPFPYIVHDQKIKIQPKDLDALSYVFK
ncbi:DUF2318 domain-containing protein [uncultured Peptoniphilus sp.]|uniref:DUF2318 domain-containing protein n=1 Tax=uncultured Peptoniphilus sp. TaxID=254354 RepID=UPI0028044A92|nr:DUF2318 domain-containing protein [uncultured Peptoniphilus sp.]